MRTTSRPLLNVVQSIAGLPLCIGFMFRSSKKLMNESKVKVTKEESPEKGEGSTPKRRYRRRSSKGSAEKGEGSTPKRRYRRRSSVASKEGDEDHPKKKRGRLSAEREKNREESSDTDSEVCKNLCCHRCLDRGLGDLQYCSGRSRR